MYPFIPCPLSVSFYPLSFIPSLFFFSSFSNMDFNNMEIVDLTDEDNEYHAVIIGDPMPKPAPRCYVKLMGFDANNRPRMKRWTWNSAEKKMKETRQLIQHQLHGQNNTSTFPIFQDTPVWIKVWFCKRPPNKYFMNNDRTRPKRILHYDSSNKVILPDTDNCIKFILDSLSTVAWDDDKQVSSIMAWKCLDTHPPYEGRTVIEFGSNRFTVPIPTWAQPSIF